MRIGFIGAGKMGSALGLYFKTLGYEIAGYYSRRAASTEYASEMTESKAYSSIEDLVAASDVIFMTVTDGQIASVAESILSLSLSGKYICHCSGVLSSQVFSNLGERGAYGISIHPYMAIHDPIAASKELFHTLFTIEGDEEAVQGFLLLFDALPNRILRIKAEDKVSYHASAVMAGNLLLGLLKSSQDLLMSCGFSEEDARDLLIPYMIENLRNAENSGIEGALTGPLERGDMGTLQKHMSVMTEDEAAVYRALSYSLLPLAREKHPDRDYREIEEYLHG